MRVRCVGSARQSAARSASCEGGVCSKSAGKSGKAPNPTKMVSLGRMIVTHPNDLDAPCASLRRARLTTTANSQNISFFTSTCTASFSVFYFYRPTGRPRRTSRPRNASATTLRFFSLPPRSVLQWLEEQTGCGENGSFAGRSQHQRQQHRSSPGSPVTVFARSPHRLCPGRLSHS